MRPNLQLVRAVEISPMELADGVLHYLKRLEARGARQNTLAAYGNDLAQYVAFATRLEQGTLVAVQSSRHVSRFLDDQDAAGISRRSQARRLSVLRMFYRHAIREGWIGHDPTADEHVRYERVRVVAPEMDALHTVIDLIPRDAAANWRDLRDRALLRTMLDTGLRITAARMLDIPGVGSASDVDLRRQLAHFVCKGGKASTKPFNDATAAMLEAYMAVRVEHAAPGCVAVFIGGNGQRLSRTGVHQIIVRRGAAAGIKLHAHLVRHRRGAHVIECCGEKVAQQFLDHASLNTTSNYGAHADTVACGMLRKHADIDAARASA